MLVRGYPEHKDLPESKQFYVLLLYMHIYSFI